MSLLRFSLNNFPVDAGLKDGSGLPWGCIVQPFCPAEKHSPPIFKEYITSNSVSRCEKCFGYINPYVKIIDRKFWKCCLCGNKNKLAKKYKVMESKGSFPELTHAAIEYDVEEEENHANEFGHHRATEDDIFSAYIAVVDLTGPKEFLSLVKDGLLAALEALPPTSYFGLLTFSDRVGIYDLNSPQLHVKHVPIPASSPCRVPLTELFPLWRFLARIDTCLSNISAAIDNLINQSSFDGKRGFGSAFQALVDYFALSETTGNVRTAVFLSGHPNYGQGTLTEDKTQDLSPQTPFYSELAEKTAKQGLCVDLFVVSNSYVGLSSIKFLSMKTGGNVMMYGLNINAPLPQDIYRQLNKAQAMHGMLRLRTSEEFSVSHHFGHLYPDATYENLYHIVGCDQYKTFAFDFEFSSPSGFFNLESDTLPTIQMVFIYNYIPEGGAAVKLQRKLRVFTVQLKVAENQHLLYNGADSDCTLAMLTHKIIHASLDENIREARLLLQDWLIIFLTRYNENIHPSPTLKDVDVTLSKYPNLKSLPRLVFALQKSSILGMENVRADSVIYFHCLYSSIEPALVHRALYPSLNSFGAPNNLASQNLSLALSVVSSSGSRIFLVDAFTVICVYYLFESEDLPFPPPKDSLIRSMINNIKAERHITPDIIFAKAGTPEESYFNMFLIEELNTRGISLTQFLDTIAKEIKKSIKR